MTLIQERFAVDGVKSVGEVNFEKHGRRVSGVAPAPLTRRLEADFCSQRLSNADLKGEEQATGPVLVLRAQAFSGEAPERFAHRYRPSRPVLLREGGQGGPC